MNWTKPPAPADTELIIHYNKKEPEKSVVKTNAKQHLIPLLAGWLKQHSERLATEGKDIQAETVGNEYIVALYFYNDGRPIETRSNTGNRELNAKFILYTIHLLSTGTVTPQPL